MDAFSLLKYWRSSAGGITTTISAADSTADARATAEIVSARISAASPYSTDGEDGPFFDLEFSLPDQESDADEPPPVKSHQNDQKPSETENEDETGSESDAEEISVYENEDIDDEEEEDDEDGGGELKFALASNDCADQAAAALSPSDELFFKGNLVSVEPSSILLSGSSEENSKLPIFLVKSATKFRVLLLKLKKSKSGNGENLTRHERAEKIMGNGKRENQGKVSGKLMAVKLKVEEGPLMSLFTRDNSAKENGHGRGLAEGNNVDERKLTKEVVLQKYLKMVKLRVSKRYVEKLKFTGGQSVGSGGSKISAPAARGDAKPQEKHGSGGNNLQAGLKVVRKHLGKSRSASASVAASPPRKAASNRRDDSLVQLHDGIQGAILHCKRSFNASRDIEPSSILCRSKETERREAIPLASTEEPPLVSALAQGQKEWIDTKSPPNHPQLESRAGQREGNHPSPAHPQAAWREGAAGCF
ncbi:Probable membrane-associated kinase regulator 2 [Striga hermonthica]|uniref:Probable membrane-associated kinase regulator 2 n=1 Tax=Striga hermonthica TaxID=68872 RepID=A0A9N7MRB6_STRHE|nr:Probable membrane-associated kinase regulator 2 [Striga hermonthica]